ncbi:hypothetical protein Pyn_38583 [Prunus yedoensis var. nudiflora]|uniref:Uncharacterized protein n=1 Tax=Prunus yedoensis var. nudiflora TaxID=2094558 RepID=A0A314ZVY8_PRUYE|nr:hypothetical protein Pyn_38583 [Prunus yedoensis var. nudiflora]
MAKFLFSMMVERLFHTSPMPLRPGSNQFLSFLSMEKRALQMARKLLSYSCEPDPGTGCCWRAMNLRGINGGGGNWVRLCK